MSLNVGIFGGYEDSWSLFANLGGLYSVGDVGFLKDVRFGVAVSNLGKPFSKTTLPGIKPAVTEIIGEPGEPVTYIPNAGAFPQIGTLQLGAGALLLSTEYVKIGTSLDFTTPLFQNFIMDAGLQFSIKDMLLDIQESKLEFTVTMTGKESKRVNGLYKPETREILLHNKNFKTDNELIYTAVHEYTHHLINEENIVANGGREPPHQARSHTNYFWAKFHALLEVAEEKGYYKIDLSSSPELEELTKEIREKYIVPNGRLMQEFGKKLIQAHALCEKSSIRYEDYLDRVLQIPRTTAKTVAQVGTLPTEDADLGFDNMKIVAGIKKPDERAKAQEAIKSGKSPDSVIAMMKKKASETDPKTKLEKERDRLTKTINELTHRLEFVEESLASL